MADFTYTYWRGAKFVFASDQLHTEFVDNEKSASWVIERRLESGDNVSRYDKYKVQAEYDRISQAHRQKRKWDGNVGFYRETDDYDLVEAAIEWESYHPGVYHAVSTPHLPNFRKLHAQGYFKDCTCVECKPVTKEKDWFTPGAAPKAASQTRARTLRKINESLLEDRTFPKSTKPKYPDYVTEKDIEHLDALDRDIAEFPDDFTKESKRQEKAAYLKVLADREMEKHLNGATVYERKKIVLPKLRRKKHSCQLPDQTFYNNASSDTVVKCATCPRIFYKGYGYSNQWVAQGLISGVPDGVNHPRLFIAVAMLIVTSLIIGSCLLVGHPLLAVAGVLGIPFFNGSSVRPVATPVSSEIPG